MWHPTATFAASPSSRVSLKRNVVANYLGQAWVALMALAFVPVYIGYLGMEAFGLIGLFVVIQAWLTLLDMGMTPTVTREMARFEAGEHSAQSIADLLRTLELLCAGIAMLIIIAMTVAAGWLANHWLRADSLSPQTVEAAVCVAGVVVALRFVEGLYRGAIYGLQRQVWFNVVNAGVSTVRSVGMIAVLAWVAPTIEAFLIWQAVWAAVPLAMYAWKVHAVLPRARQRPRFSSRALADVRHFAGGMMATTAVVLLLTQVDKVLLSRLLPLESFGYYALASAVAGALAMLLVPITNAVYPRMVVLVTSGESGALASLYHFSAQLVTVALVPAALLLALHSQGVLFAWSGNSALAAQTAPLLSVLALGTMLNGLMYVPFHLQLAHGWTSLALRWNLMAVVVFVPAIWWLVPTHGGIAAAWIWVCLNVCNVTVVAPLMFRRLLTAERGAWYRTDVLWPCAGVLTVLLATLPLRPLTYTGRWQWLGFLLLVSAAAILAAVVLSPQVRSRLGLQRDTEAPDAAA